MKIKILNNYINDENTYIVYNENTNEGLVIDPGYPDNEIINFAEENKIKIKYILLTHCHYDHIEYLEPLRKKTKAKLLSSFNCSKNIGEPDINHSVSGLGYALKAEKSDMILKDGEEINLCGINVKCIYTEGHTNGGVCYLFDNKKLFSGDTLFLRSIGRSDLPTGSGEKLLESIKDKLYTLDENIEVYPGHGKSTSIGYEKKFNMFIKG